MPIVGGMWGAQVNSVTETIHAYACLFSDSRMWQQLAIQLSLEGGGQVNSRATCEELIVELGEKERERERAQYM